MGEELKEWAHMWGAKVSNNKLNNHSYLYSSYF